MIYEHEITMPGSWQMEGDVDGIIFSVYRSPDGQAVRGVWDEEPGAVTSENVYILIRVEWPGEDRIVMKVPISPALRDNDLETLLTRRENIAGFILQAKAQKVQASETVQ